MPSTPRTLNPATPRRQPLQQWHLRINSESLPSFSWISQGKLSPMELTPFTVIAKKPTQPLQLESATMNPDQWNQPTGSKSVSNRSLLSKSNQTMKSNNRKKNPTADRKARSLRLTFVWRTFSSKQISIYLFSFLSSNYEHNIKHTCIRVMGEMLEIKRNENKN